MSQPWGVPGRSGETLGQMHLCRGMHASPRASIGCGVKAPGEEGGEIVYFIKLDLHCINQKPLLYCTDSLRPPLHLAMGCRGVCAGITAPEGKALIAVPDGVGQYTISREGSNP